METQGTAKHTPGPWAAEQSPDDEWFILGPDCDDDPYSGVVVQTGINGEANARLIAAAPELLAACEKALSFHDRYCDRVGAADGWARSVHEALRAAIAKARGEGE